MGKKLVIQVMVGFESFKASGVAQLLLHAFQILREDLSSLDFDHSSCGVIPLVRKLLNAVFPIKLVMRLSHFTVEGRGFIERL